MFQKKEKGLAYILFVNHYISSIGLWIILN